MHHRQWFLFATVAAVLAGTAGDAKLWQLTAPAGAVPVPAVRGGFGFGPPATMAESSLPRAPRTLTLPPSSISVVEFQVKQ